MKIKVKNYVFDASARTIVFSDYATIQLDNIILITDVTTGTIIYNFAAANLTGSVSGNVLTLNYNTSALANTTQLSIYYEEDNIRPATDEAVILLRRLVKILEPVSVQDTANRQRVVVDTGALVSVGSVGSLGSCGPVSSLTSIDGINPRFQFIDAARTAYAVGIRTKLN